MRDHNLSQRFLRRCQRALLRPSALLALCFGFGCVVLIWSHAATTASFPEPPASLNQPMGRDGNSHHRSNPPKPNSTVAAVAPASTSNSTTTIGTIVIHVRGEMGNHLQKIAHGYGLHWFAASKDRDPVNHFQTAIRVRHLKKAKWMTARDDIYQCFPKLRSLDYESAHHPDFQAMVKEQSAWFSQKDPALVATLKEQVGAEQLTDIAQGLRAMKELASSPRPYSSYPIVSLGGPMRNSLLDKFYDQYQDLFEFDSDACCAQLPEPDEVVFHFRHFAKELSIEEQQLRGFEELDPQRVATMLLGHLKPGQKVAMTTRFANEPIVQEYLDALQKQRGLQVRLIVNQTGVQDFCFLLRAQQELVGVAKSTYARWAAYLGSSKRAQLYALNNTGSQDFIQQTMKYPWSHPQLKGRIRWPVFHSITSPGKDTD